MNFLELKNYNLNKTLLGGQAFNWDFINNSFYGFTVYGVIKIQEVENGILWQTYPSNNQLEQVTNLLNTNHNFEQILKEISTDSQVNIAIQKVENVRILKQDFNQTLLSFILSAHKNIKAVRKTVCDLSKKYGSKLIIDGITFYTFPTASRLATLSESDIRLVGAGFRSKAFLEAAIKLAENPNMGKDLSLMSESSARAELIKFRGIGEKVADCILTFSLGFYSVTPIDIWAYRVLEELYGVNIKTKYSNLRTWYYNRFKHNTAWAGQFLFEYLRDNYKDIKEVSLQK